MSATAGVPGMAPLELLNDPPAVCAAGQGAAAESLPFDDAAVSTYLAQTRLAKPTAHVK